MNRSSPVSQGHQALRPRARILHTLGDELISSERVAVVELVKNSYDADATKVVLRFTGPLTPGKGKLEVIDNGHGMSLETLTTAWMEPATLFRQREPRSESRNRTVLGEKGIGRFAAARLGRTLDLVTRREGSPTEVRAYFDWSQFDDPARYLDEIEVLWEEGQPVEFVEGGAAVNLLMTGVMAPEDGVRHGTLLRMEELRSEWNRDLLADLRLSLSRLISPHWTDQVVPSDRFDIWIEVSDDKDVVSEQVEPPDTLKQPRYIISGRVESDGSFRLQFRATGHRLQNLSGTFPLKSGRPPTCGPFAVDLRVWDRDASSLSELAGSIHATVSDVRRDLDQASGISIYRDSFRVFPYGEPQQDWLRLDLRRVQNPTLRVSNNQVVGVVSISRETNPSLRDQTNREGLMEGQALNDLRELIRQVLGELEVRRYALRRTTKQDAKSPGLFRGFDLGEIRQAIQDRHADDKELLAAIDDKETDLERRVAQVQEVLARYRRLATLGQLIDRILHDGRTPLSKLGNEAQLALRDIERAAKPSEELITILKRRLANIGRQKVALDSLLTRIEPFGGRQRGRPAQLVLEKVIDDAFNVLGSEIAELGVTVTLPEGSTNVTMDRAEIEQVIVNLLQNSLYWLRQVPKGRRAIDVRITRGADAVAVTFSDSGPGVPIEFRDQIFEPYFTTKPDGIGLGLTIVGEIVSDYYGGEVALVDSGPLPGATFRLILRKRI